MVAHQQHALVAEARRQPLGLVAEPHAAETVVERDAVEKAHRVLVDRRQPVDVERREHGRVPRVQVQHAARLRRLAVHRAVDCPGGRIGRAGAVHRGIVVRVEQQQFARADAREMAPERVDQKPAAGIVDRAAEMVGDTLVQAEARAPAKRRGEIDAEVVMRIGFGRRRVAFDDGY